MEKYYVIYYHVLAVMDSQLDGPNSFRGRPYKKTWTKRYSNLQEVMEACDKLAKGQCIMTPVRWHCCKVLGWKVKEVQETVIASYKVSL